MSAYSRGKPAYSHVVTVTGPGKSIYIAGQLARDAEGNIVGPGDMRAQLEQTFKNLDACLKAAGATWADVVKTNTFVTDYQFGSWFRRSVGEGLGSSFRWKPLFHQAGQQPVWRAAVGSVSSCAPRGPRNRRRPNLRMRLRWANSISTRLRSRRDCSKA